MPAAAETRSRCLNRSDALKEEAKRLIPGCAQTFSKGPSQFVQGVSPNFLARAQASRVWDVDGNDYIDYINGLLPVVLGHNYPAVTEAVIAQLQNGVAFSLPHPIEVELARALTEIIPCAEMVRFGKNGSDATSGAVRAARAITNRDVIACCGYHGWQDWYIGSTSRSAGVPESVRALTAPFVYNDLESLKTVLRQHRNQVAAVIMEPVAFTPPAPGFLEGVRDLARENGALLIFDEICTGFRLALGGAQAFFDVVPDLACFGKAMGNGFPISAVVGKADYMSVFEEIFFSFTFGGEAISLAASLAVIREMQEKAVIAHLWKQGKKLQDGLNTLAREFGLENNVNCVGYPCWTYISLKDADGQDSVELRSLFQQEACKRGLLVVATHNMSFSHTNTDIADTLEAYQEILPILADAVRCGDAEGRLEGPPIRPVFQIRR